MKEKQAIEELIKKEASKVFCLFFFFQKSATTSKTDSLAGKIQVKSVSPLSFHELWRDIIKGKFLSAQKLQGESFCIWT